MKVIIIGAQGAGLSVAARLKRNVQDANITVIDQGSEISFGACGLPYYIGNFFDNENLLFSKSQEELKNNGINILTLHQVIKVFPDKQVVTFINKTNNETYEESYDKLVIATGSKSKGTNLINENNTFIVKDLQNAKLLKSKLEKKNTKSVTILGAGYIGLEILEALKQYKHIETINIVDSKNILSEKFIDEDFEFLLKQELQNHSINIHLNSIATNIENSTSNVKISLLTNNNKEQSISSDILILALGFTPNTEIFDNINFDKYENGALLVDKVGKTNIPNIYAIGDCATVYHKILKQNMYIPLANIANKMGRVVADDIANKKINMSGFLGSSCVKILDLEIGKTGITESEAKRYNIPYNATFIQDYNHTNYYPNNSKLYMKVLTEKNSSKIIGGQIVGKNNTLLRLHALSVAIEAGMNIKDLGNLDFAYSPPFTRTWEALNILGNIASKKTHNNIK